MVRIKEVVSQPWAKAAIYKLILTILPSCYYSSLLRL